MSVRSDKVVYITMNEISNMAFFCLLLFLTVPILISYKNRLGLGKDILVSSFRGFVQLMALGFIVSFLFSLTKWYLIFPYVLFMMTIASYNAGKKSGNRKKTFFIVFAAMFTSVSVVLVLWLSFSIVPFQSRYIIPTSGMFCGTSMIASSVVLELIKSQQEKGIYSQQEAIRVAMVPTIENLRTAGLVTIPGLMTGMLLSESTSGLDAAKYQIFVMISLVMVASLSSYIVTYLYGKSDQTKKA